MQHSNQKSVVCIGGGTGTFVTLRGLKQFPLSIKAIVAMSDSGGSNKRIRDEFGLLPTSDLRQCLVALSDENGGVGVLRKLFMYRFDKGKGISGMTFGNLFMAALSDILGSQSEAIRQTSKILRIRGSVIPVSYTNTNLVASYEDGSVLEEEHFIDEPPHDGRLKITSISLKPKAIANPDAIEAITHADLIVLGPGDLYTSVIPNLLVESIVPALVRSKAKRVYVMNLMTKFGQTHEFTALDHVNALEKYLGKSIDYVLINTGSFSKKALEVYAKYHEKPVVDDVSKKSYYHVIHAPIVHSILVKKTASDTLVRSLIRHDSKKLAEQLFTLID